MSLIKIKRDYNDIMIILFILNNIKTYGTCNIDKHKQTHTHTRTHKRAAVYVCVCVWQGQRQKETESGGRWHVPLQLQPKLTHLAPTWSRDARCDDDSR